MKSEKRDVVGDVDMIFEVIKDWVLPLRER